MSETYSRGRGHRRKRKAGLTTAGKVVLAVIVLLAVLAGVFAVTKIINKDDIVKEPVVTLEPESELSEEVTVGGVNITGKGRTEALIAIEKKYPWDVKVTLSGSENPVYEVPNLIEPEINRILDMVYGGHPEADYELTPNIDRDALDRAIAEMEAMWNKEAVNGSISGFDKATESFVYSGEIAGYEFDSDAVRIALMALNNSGKFKASIKASGHKVFAEIDEEEAKALYRTIGDFTTKSTANPDRNNNLRLASEAIDGLVLQAGDEFTFNLTTGNRTVEKGYKAAGAYQNGQLVDEPGGGVCQVASTLYHAVVQAGLEITERHPHSFEPSYVTPGTDATVSYDGYNGPDLKFVNNTSSAIVVRAHYENQTVHCWIIGIPILPEGETIEFVSEKVATLDVPVPMYEEDPTIPPHTEELVSEGDQGSRWITKIVRMFNGQEKNVEREYSSTYKGHNPKIKRNSTDVQINAEGLIVRQVETNEAGEIVNESLGPGYVPSEGDSSAAGPGATTYSVPATTAAQTSGSTAAAQETYAVEAPTAPDDDVYDEPFLIDAPGF